MGLFYINVQAGARTSNANLRKIERTLLSANTRQFVKVQGEQRYIIVLDSPDVDRVVAPLNDLGLSFNITCSPLIPYETFAKNTLQFDEKLLPQKNTPAPIDITKPLFFVHFTVEYQGRTEEEMRHIWGREALGALTLVYEGKVPVVLYKVVASRQVIAFMQMDGPSLDIASFELPLMKLMGDQVTVVSKAVKMITGYS